MIHRTLLLSVVLQLLLLALPLTLLRESPAGAVERPAEAVTEAPTEPGTEALTEPVTEPIAEPVTEPAAEPMTEAPTEPEALAETVTVLLPDGAVETMELEDYLWGVVAAEMPASFAPEALKAQAVAARSYTRWQMAHPSDRHPAAQVCTDYACCQAWLSRSDRLAAWDEADRAENERRVTEAVTSTAGETLDYDGAPALAVFHASSAGHTRSAAQVWGAEIPYLVSVDSPEGEGDAPNYYSVVKLSLEDFRAAVERERPEAELGEDVSGWLTREGDALTIGGVSLTAQEVRGLFGLRSATFTVECGAEGVTFYVTGYGHGVGMSQYGANVMAKQGSGYREILAHYYPGTEIVERGG